MNTQASRIRNFGRNVDFVPQQYFQPANETELLKILQDYRGQKFRVVGQRHAWSPGISTSACSIELCHFDWVRIEPGRRTVVVGAGCRIKTLLAGLAAHGLTLPSIGLIDEQTIAGATATGTHGSGKNSLSHYIVSAKVAHFDPETGHPVITNISEGPELRAIRCSLGLPGIVVELELRCRPSYNVQEHSRRHSLLADILEAETEFPLQQFFLMPWSWQLFAQHRVETTASRNILSGLYRVYWHIGIDWILHLVICTLCRLLRLGSLIRVFYRRVIPLVVIRNWRITDEAARILLMQHELFRHIEIEIFVRREQLPASLDFLRRVITVFGGRDSQDGPVDPQLNSHRGTYCHHYPICVRRVLCDDTLISMASPWPDGSCGDCYAISLISYQWPGDRQGFFQFARYIAGEMYRRFEARAHWGKWNPLTREQNELLYPRLNEFREMVRRFDSDGCFCNDWLEESIAPQVGPTA